MSRAALYRDLAPYYDRLYSFKDYPGEVERLRAIIDRKFARPARSLLDVGCGTGHHLELLRKWYDVAGVDASPAMLRVARSRLGPSVPLFRGDMRAFDLGRRFDVLVCLFSAFGYMATPADRARAARNFFRHLTPGGLALIEGWVLPDRWKAGRPVHVQSYVEPRFAIVRVTDATRRGRWTTLAMDYLVAEAGRPTRHFRELHRQPLVPSEEHLRCFRRAGFSATMLRGGGYRDRGLYVLRRPSEPDGGAR